MLVGNPSRFPLLGSKSPQAEHADDDRGRDSVAPLDCRNGAATARVATNSSSSRPQNVVARPHDASVAHRDPREINHVRTARALQVAVWMRRLVVVACLLAACGGRQTAWTTLAPSDLPDDGEAFVLIGNSALHLRHVEQVDGHVQAVVIHAWALPRAGAVAIADDTRSTSPEEVARGAGWPELRIVRSRLDVPIGAIRSARGVVGIEQAPTTNDADPRVAIEVVAYALDFMLRMGVFSR